MKAMMLKKLGALESRHRPLELADVPTPRPATGQVLVKVSACAVCHTELDEIEGRTPPLNLPVILGHQVVGRVAETGKAASAFKAGDRVGIGWIYSACGKCEFCRAGNENLCPEFRATGKEVNGGYAEYIVVPEASAYPIADLFSDSQAAPLLCAGAIGYRSFRLAGLQNGRSLGLTGFGASAHLVLQMVRYRFPKSPVIVFARSEAEQNFARELGAAWAGPIGAETPQKLDRIIDTTPAWNPVVEALANLAPGGRLVINAIGKEESDKNSLLKLDYPRHLWLEKEIKSVANVTRADIKEFLELAAAIPIEPKVQEFRLGDANQALAELKAGNIRGAKVLVIG
jgi:propanol-preferring alcohol dehydrogenase